MSPIPQSWWILALAIGLEVAGTTSLKLSDGFTRWPASALVVLFYGASFYALALALKRLDVSVAYAVWAGTGTAMIAVIGAGWFGETLTPARLVCIGLIVVGVVGLNVAGSRA